MSEKRTVVARAIFNEMRGRAGIKQFFLHVKGKPSEGDFEDHQEWLEEVAGTVLAALLAPPAPEAVKGDDPVVGAPKRFFIEHGIIHDRNTGKHVRTDTPDWLNDDGINEALTLLNTLSAELASARGVEIPGLQGMLEAERDAVAFYRSRVQTAEAALKVAGEALGPFARYMAAAGFDLNHKGEPLPDENGVGWVYLTIGNFRRATEATQALAMLEAGG